MGRDESSLRSMEGKAAVPLAIQGAAHHPWETHGQEGARKQASRRCWRVETFYSIGFTTASHGSATYHCGHLNSAAERAHSQ